MDTIGLRRPDDFHVHLRQGGDTDYLLPFTARQFSRALVMPNLNPPILTGQEAADYMARLRRIAEMHPDPAVQAFRPLPTIKLTDKTTPELVRDAAANHGIFAAKLYPAGVTTNSHDGVTDLPKLRPVFEAMQELEMVLCLHAEEPGAPTLDRERIFLDRHLFWLTETCPRLRIVVEHLSTWPGVGMVSLCGPKVAATITVHHLVLTLEDVIGDMLKPHHFCKPVAKFETDREALVRAATSGNPKFFLGTDSAPHLRSKKECSACAAGCFTAPVAMPLLAEIFEAAGALDKLEDFTSANGARFYRLSLNSERLTLIREPWVVPHDLSVAASRNSSVFNDYAPFWAGKTLTWKVAEK